MFYSISTSLVAIIVRPLHHYKSALYLVEPCRSLEKLLKSHKGEYARLLAPNDDDQGATACVELVWASQVVWMDALKNYFHHSFFL